MLVKLKINAQTNVIAGTIYHIKLVIADDNSDGGLTYW
jgi:hypothetical protein